MNAATELPGHGGCRQFALQQGIERRTDVALVYQAWNSSIVLISRLRENRLIVAFGPSVSGLRATDSTDTLP